MDSLNRAMRHALPVLTCQAMKIARGDERVPGRDRWALRVMAEALHESNAVTTLITMRGPDPEADVDPENE